MKKNFIFFVYSLIGKTLVCGIKDIGSNPIRHKFFFYEKECGVMET